MNTRKFLILLGLVLGISAGQSSYGDINNATITWTGDNGSVVRILMAYDTSFTSVGALGDQYGFATPTNQGISSLSVLIRPPPSSLRPAFFGVDITNGAIAYRFLRISFNTESKSLFGRLDVGKDSFSEGEPGSSMGQYYLAGDATDVALNDPFASQVIDSGGYFLTTVTPEPSTWSLGGMGLVAIAMITWRSRSQNNPNASA